MTPSLLRERVGVRVQHMSDRSHSRNHGAEDSPALSVHVIAVQ